LHFFIIEKVLLLIGLAQKNGTMKNTGLTIPMEKNDQRKRIAIVCSPLALNGGTFKHLLSWCRNFDRQKFKLALFCNYINSEHEQIAKPYFSAIPELYYHPVKNIFPFKTLLRGGWLRFVKALRNFRPHLVHSVFPQADLICAATNSLTGFPIQISSWEGRLAHEALHSNSITWLYKQFFIPAQRIISRFVAISAATASQNCSDFGIDARKISVIHSGLNLSQFIFKSERKSKIIGLVSRLSMEKQIDIFIHAIPIIAEHHADYRFIIAGDGPEREKLEALVKACNVSDITRFVGWQTDIPAILEMLDIFVFTSSGEGLPWSILEAMAAGCPVVASSVGGIPEIIEDGVSGLLVNSSNPVDFADKIQSLLNSYEKRLSIAKMAREKIESAFTERYEIKAFENLYLELLKS